MLEALLAFALSASLLGIVANELYTSPLTQHSYDFGLGNALYDFPSMLYHNSTYRECFSSANSTCERIAIQQLRAFFLLKYARFSDAGTAIEDGSPSDCARFQERCYLSPEGGVYTLACLSVCD